MTQSVGKAFTVQGILQDTSIVNTGSGAQVLGGNQLRNYLLIHNPNAVSVGVNLAGNTASVGAAGTVTLVAAGTLIFENGFIPLNQIQICGSSGNAITVYQG